MRGGQGHNNEVFHATILIKMTIVMIILLATTVTMIIIIIIMRTPVTCRRRGQRPWKGQRLTVFAPIQTTPDAAGLVCPPHPSPVWGWRWRMEGVGMLTGGGYDRSSGNRGDVDWWWGGQVVAVGLVNSYLSRGRMHSDNVSRL